MHSSATARAWPVTARRPDDATAGMSPSPARSTRRRNPCVAHEKRLRRPAGQCRRRRLSRATRANVTEGPAPTMHAACATASASRHPWSPAAATRPDGFRCRMFPSYEWRSTAGPGLILRAHAVRSGPLVCAAGSTCLRDAIAAHLKPDRRCSTRSHPRRRARHASRAPKPSAPAPASARPPGAVRVHARRPAAAT